MSEYELQAAIKAALKAKGYTVLDTSVYGSPRVMRQSKMGAASKGLPDLFVRGDGYPRWLWIGMEVKLPKGGVKPEQKALADKGAIVIVRSVDEAITAVNQVHAELTAAMEALC